MDSNFKVFDKTRLGIKSESIAPENKNSTAHKVAYSSKWFRFTAVGNVYRVTTEAISENSLSSFPQFIRLFSSANYRPVGVVLEEIAVSILGPIKLNTCRKKLATAATFLRSYCSSVAKTLSRGDGLATRYTLRRYWEQCFYLS